MWRGRLGKTHISEGEMNRFLISPGREPTTDQSHNSTQEQVGKIMGLYGLFIETWVTPKYLYHQNFLL